MKTIYRYPLKNIECQTISMPEHANIISVDFIEEYNNFEVLNLWAEVETENCEEKRTFIMLGTGAEIPDMPLKYLSSVSRKNRYRFHIYEVI